MRFSTFRSFAAGMLAIAGTAAPLAATAEELVLRAAAFTPMETTWGIPFHKFVEHVNETGKGVLQINAMGPEAMPATEQPNALRSGLLDLIATPPGMYKQVVGEANAQDLSNLSLAEQRASGGYAALNTLTRERLNAEMLTTYGPGVNFHLYLTQPITDAAALNGLRVRTQPIFGPFFDSLGLSGTTIPIPETYTALERGVVQGYGFPAWGVQDLGWTKLTKVRVEPGFYNVVVNILINGEKLDSLTPEQRAVLDESVAWFEAEMVTYQAEQNVVHLAAQDEAGITGQNLGEDFAQQAANIYWGVLEDENPESIPELRALLQR